MWGEYGRQIETIHPAPSHHKKEKAHNTSTHSAPFVCRVRSEGHVNVLKQSHDGDGCSGMEDDQRLQARYFGGHIGTDHRIDHGINVFFELNAAA